MLRLEQVFESPHLIQRLSREELDEIMFRFDFYTSLMTMDEISMVLAEIKDREIVEEDLSELVSNAFVAPEEF